MPSNKRARKKSKSMWWGKSRLKFHYLYRQSYTKNPILASKTDILISSWSAWTWQPLLRCNSSHQSLWLTLILSESSIPRSVQVNATWKRLAMSRSSFRWHRKLSRRLKLTNHLSPAWITSTTKVASKWSYLVQNLARISRVQPS